MARRLTPAVVGWLLVGVQALLLALIWLVGSGDDWPTPWPVVALGWVATGIGAGVMLLAFRTLGPALTPTPEPRAGGRLRRDGPYRLVRHPIYSGVLLVIAGWVVRSGRWATLAIGLATLGFFHAKAAWEERRLAASYPAYAAYARSVPRFVPSWRAGRPAP